MKLSIESTSEVLVLDGVPVRVWRGRTDGGIECHVFVHRLAVSVDADSSQFDRELLQTMGPGSVDRQPVSAVSVEDQLDAANAKIVSLKAELRAALEKLSDAGWERHDAIERTLDPERES